MGGEDYLGLGPSACSTIGERPVAEHTGHSAIRRLPDTQRTKRLSPLNFAPPSAQRLGCG